MEISTHPKGRRNQTTGCPHTEAGSECILFLQSLPECRISGAGDGCAASTVKIAVSTAEKPPYLRTRRLRMPVSFCAVRIFKEIDAKLSTYTGRAAINLL